MPKPSHRDSRSFVGRRSSRGIAVGRLVVAAVAAAGAALALGACGGATQEQLSARAAFDLNCPSTQVQVVAIDDRTRGVTGCGKRATYVETCGMTDGYGGKHDCTWLLNTEKPAAE